MMLRSLPVALLVLLVSACSSPRNAQQSVQLSVQTPAQQSEQFSVQDSIQYPAQYPGQPKLATIQVEKVEHQIKPHWQLSYFDEPVFNSKVAVLEAGNKQKPPIILIHGLGNLGMKDWFSVIPTLEENHHVIVMDLPGFGLSSAAKGRFLPTNYAHVIAAISKQYSNGKAIIMGHSMGGAVALRYTELYQDFVNQLILVDVAGLLEKSAFIKHIASFEFGDEVSTPMKLLMGGVNDISSSLIEAGTKSTLLSDFLQSNDYAWNLAVSDSSNMNAALSLVEEDFNTAINQITVPVNIIWGEKDNVAPLRTGKVLNKKMSNVHLEVIEGAGHVPMKSDHAEFMRLLQVALNEPFNKNSNRSFNKTITTNFTSPHANKSQGVLTCRNESHKTYSGHYDKIVIESCNMIRLLNVSTDSLKIKGSVVDIENFNFARKDSRIEFDGAVVTITNADISGRNTMLISGSRVDMAGVSIEATGNAVMIANGSRVSASFCDINSPKYSGVLHGAFYRSHQALIEH